MIKPLFPSLVILLVSILAIASGNVKATFKADKQTGPLPLSVSFKGVDENPSVSYAWDFGNGSTSMRKEATTMFVNPGTYTVKLVVNNGVATDSSFMSIEVLPNPDMVRMYKEKASNDSQ
jgi:PKD repeat protein